MENILADWEKALAERGYKRSPKTLSDRIDEQKMERRTPSPVIKKHC